MPASDSVRAVTFDGDGTLWDLDTAMRAALERSAQTLTSAGLRRPDGPIGADWLAGVREEVASRPEHRGDSMESIRLASFCDSIRRCGPEDDALAKSVYDQYMRDRLAELRLYPDVERALAALRSRYRLALVTNGNTDPGQIGLGEVFEEIVVAFECGLHKPDPAIYSLTAERLELEPAACVHVGDDPEEDVDAARAAGLAAIWLNRKHQAWPSQLEPPAAEIDSLSELPELLPILGGRAGAA